MVAIYACGLRPAISRECWCGYGVIRNNNGGFESEDIARIIRDVVVEIAGEAVKKKARASTDIEGEAKAQKKAHDDKMARP